MSTQETRECLLCLRIPLESIRSSVEALLPHVDDAVIDRVSERAAKLIATAYEKDRFALCGKKPSGLMAAAIYLSGKVEKEVKISQGLVAREMNITEVTVRNRTHQINDLLGLEIMEQHQYVQPERRKQYVCLFCEEAFPALCFLQTHLWRKKIKNSSTLKVWMFNEDGILVDKEMIERLKRWEGNLVEPEFYLCPFCEEPFRSLNNLKRHLRDSEWKYSSKLRVRMFNDDGIMVDEDVLKKMKWFPSTCKRPPVVEVTKIKRSPAVDVANIIRGQGSGLSYFGQGDPLATRRRYNS